MPRIFAVLCLVIAVSLSTGCSMVAPRYTASLPNVQVLKDGGTQAVKVGTFKAVAALDNENPISLRGSSLASPYDASYAHYLAQALTQELTMAGRLAPDAQIEVTGELQKNGINIPAVGSGTGNITARFIVTREGAVRYDATKTIHDEWESSFVGAIAIPKAQEQYPLMVQKLLAQLYADPTFIQALK